MAEIFVMIMTVLYCLRISNSDPSPCLSIRLLHLFTLFIPSLILLCCAGLCCAVIRHSVSCWGVQHRVILCNVTTRCVLCGVLYFLINRLRHHLLICFSFLYSSLLIFFLSFPLPYCLPYLSRYLPPITAISRSTITAPTALLR
jgi:hypothetical protein